MYLKRERPETNAFGEEKISGCEGKVLSIFQEKTRSFKYKCLKCF